MRKARPVPSRRCVACGEVRPKRELFRVVRTPEGEVVYDPTGRRNGRGAYLCGAEACLVTALPKLNRALEATVPEEVISDVRERAQAASP